jgi:hypothetical protein
MKISYFIFILLTASLSARGQIDEEPPLSPVLELVSVDPASGNIGLSWSLSPSADVKGYIVYSYVNNEGYPIDTINNPLISNYIHTGTGSSYFSLSYVVAAVDTAGNKSLLSNPLSTIFSESSIDTCMNRIIITWVPYPSVPKQVINYSVFYSIDGSSYDFAGTADKNETEMIIEDFTTDSQYCYYIRANLQGGLVSSSNKTCLMTDMQKPPEWINADYATISSEDGILISFHTDPLSEIENFRLERKKGYNGTFEQIWEASNSAGDIIYNDSDADSLDINFYRLTAINNCNLPVTASNVASNIVLKAVQDDDNIILTWNPYRLWNGSIISNKIFLNLDDVMEERFTVATSDSSFTFSYNEIMYEVSRPEICFCLRSYEGINPFRESAGSRSQVVCIPVFERITVPNLFLPSGSTINNQFSPVLSFTPVSYHLVITDMRRNILFETRDFLEKWNGTKNGDPLPQGAYLWFLETKTPSGKNISKAGTVSILYNP